MGVMGVMGVAGVVGVVGVAGVVGVTGVKGVSGVMGDDEGRELLLMRGLWGSIKAISCLGDGLRMMASLDFRSGYRVVSDSGAGPPVWERVFSIVTVSAVIGLIGFGWG